MSTNGVKFFFFALHDRSKSSDSLAQSTYPSVQIPRRAPHKSDSGHARSCTKENKQELRSWIQKNYGILNFQKHCDHRDPRVC